MAGSAPAGVRACRLTGRRLTPAIEPHRLLAHQVGNPGHEEPGRHLLAAVIDRVAAPVPGIGIINGGPAPPHRFVQMMALDEGIAPMVLDALIHLVIAHHRPQLHILKRPHGHGVQPGGQPGAHPVMERHQARQGGLEFRPVVVGIVSPGDLLDQLQGHLVDGLEGNGGARQPFEQVVAAVTADDRQGRPVFGARVRQGNHDPVRVPLLPQQVLDDLMPGPEAHPQQGCPPERQQRPDGQE